MGVVVLIFFTLIHNYFLACNTLNCHIFGIIYITIGNGFNLMAQMSLDFLEERIHDAPPKVKYQGVHRAEAQMLKFMWNWFRPRTEPEMIAKILPKEVHQSGASSFAGYSIEYVGDILRPEIQIEVNNHPILNKYLAAGYPGFSVHKTLTPATKINDSLAAESIKSIDGGAGGEVRW